MGSNVKVSEIRFDPKGQAMKYLIPIYRYNLTANLNGY
jgi:hypothetical protein